MFRKLCMSKRKNLDPWGVCTGHAPLDPPMVSQSASIHDSSILLFHAQHLHMHGPKIRIYIRISTHFKSSVIVCISPFGAHTSRTWPFSLEGSTSSDLV